MFSPSPHERAEHDYRLCIDKLQELTAKSDSCWHNAGAQFVLREAMVESISDAISEAVRDGHNPVVAMSVIVGLHLELAFALGYELGEGPEHIIKCRCVGVNPN